MAFSDFLTDIGRALSAKLDLRLNAVAAGPLHYPFVTIAEAPRRGETSMRLLLPLLLLALAAAPRPAAADPSARPDLAARLPDGCVLDGELLVRGEAQGAALHDNAGGGAASFNALLQRLGRKVVPK